MRRFNIAEEKQKGLVHLYGAHVGGERPRLAGGHLPWTDRWVGRSGSQRMTRYSSNSTRMDTRQPILLCSQPRKQHKHQQILESAAAAAACQLEFVDRVEKCSHSWL